MEVGCETSYKITKGEIGELIDYLKEHLTELK